MSTSQIKRERIRTVLAHREADRVTVGEFFWTGFLNRCRQKWGDDFDAYRHFDLDYIVMSPNMDPKIRPFEIVSQAGDDIIVRTGFGATVRRSGTAPMPHYDSFSVDCPEDMAGFEFESPADRRRFHEGGDDQINCVGDALVRDIPSWDSRVDAYADDFAVFGSVCEPYEYLWRCIGTENSLYWMLTEPELFNDFVNRIGEFTLALCKAQIEAGRGRLAGLDVVELKKTYAGRLAFCGNIDVQVLERGDPEEIRRHVLYKLQAAKGGGWIFQSDHSISSSVSPESYKLAINTLREHGNYPLDLRSVSI